MKAETSVCRAPSPTSSVISDGRGRAVTKGDMQ